MNEFERRLIDAMQQDSWIKQVARKDKKIVDVDYFVYTATLTALAVGNSAQTNIQVQADSDFALAYMSGQMVVGGAVSFLPSTVQITDTGSGKTFFSAPALFNLVMGNAGLPFYLPAPRVIAPNTNIQLNVTNVAMGGATDYWFAFLGARIYYAN